MNEPRSRAARYRSFGKEIDCMRDRIPLNLMYRYRSRATGYATLLRINRIASVMRPFLERLLFPALTSNLNGILFPKEGSPRVFCTMDTPEERITAIGCDKLFRFNWEMLERPEGE